MGSQQLFENEHESTPPVLQSSPGLEQLVSPLQRPNCAPPSFEQVRGPPGKGVVFGYPQQSVSFSQSSPFGAHPPGRWQMAETPGIESFDPHDPEQHPVLQE